MQKTIPDLQEQIRRLCGNIREGRELRASLIELKGLVRAPKGAQYLARELGGNFDSLTVLLGNTDPKVRKNAALLLGTMETEDLLPFLFAAYQKEDTLYVRPAYLQAMIGLDVSSCRQSLAARREELLSGGGSSEMDKHLREELQAIDTLLMDEEAPGGHTFTAAESRPEVILMTNRQNREVTARQLRGRVSLLAGGVRVTGESIASLLRVRTWSEMLFVMPERLNLPADPAEAGMALARADIPAFLDRFHSGSGPYRYRMEVRGSMDPEKKGRWIKRASGALDLHAGGRMINDPGSYEVEIRLPERKDGTFAVLLKLCLLPDDRFAYRKEVMSDGMAPVNAALCACLAAPYAEEGAKVLDPFCGTGSLLIERALQKKAQWLLGVDISAEAAEKARKNAGGLTEPVRFIQQDFFRFTPREKPDEIITQLPETDGQTGLELDTGAFLDRAALMLENEGTLAVVSRRGDEIKRWAATHGDARIAESKLLNERTGTSLTIVRLGPDQTE